MPSPAVPVVPHPPSSSPPSPVGAGPTFAPPAPLPPPSTAPISGEYVLAGALTANQLIRADGDLLAHLEGKITELVLQVQGELIQQGLSEKIVEARHDIALRTTLARDIDRLVLSYLMREGRTRPEDKALMVAAVINEILGLGPLQPLWQEPSITEVIVNGPSDVFVERSGLLIKARGACFRSQEHLLDVCQRILAPLNRKLDVKDPLADGRLPDGSRVNVVHYAIAPKGPLLTIRRFPEANRSLADLVDLGSMTQEMACLMAWLIQTKASSLVVGGTGTGKTTLLNALSAAIPREERVVTIEDSLELRLHPESHVAALEARPADAAGQNAVPIRDLVKNALRMRPDRIIVGEVRGAEALNMLEACNTGHEGSMSTVHANGPDEALARLAVMIAQGGEMPPDKVDWLVSSALDIIVQIRRYKDGSRRVSGIYEVPNINDLPPGAPLRTIPLWEWHRTGEDDAGRITGEYRKANDPSQQLRGKLGLDFETPLTWDDVLSLSS